MALFNFLPYADWRNNGWQLVGGINALYQALNNDDDNKYIKCPASKADAAVTFQPDITNVPDGAVITSITVKLRVSTGAASAPSGTAPSVTVAVSAQDDTSRYITRTIFPTGTPTTFEIATYQRDALGYLWDVHRLNNLVCRIFSYLGISDLIRVFKLFCEIKYRLRPTITVTAPSGTVYTPSPTISWTYAQADGDPQKTVEYKIFTAAQVAQVSFNPATEPPVYATTLQGDVSSVILPTSINPNQYWVYVRATSSFGAKSTWVGRQFQVQGPSPAQPGVDDPVDIYGSAIVAVVPDSESGASSLSLRDTSNLLSSQEADAENASDGTTFTTTNCSIVRDTTLGFPGGTASWKLTATGAGTMKVSTDFLEVDQLVPITARAQFRTAATGRNVRAVLKFYDNTFGLIGTSYTGASVMDATGTWTEAVVYGDSPAGASFAQADFEVLSAAAGEVHNIDHLGVMYGTNSPWSDGGHASRNLLGAYVSSAEGTSVNGEGWTAANPSTTVGTNAVVGTGASGSQCFKMTYNGLNPSIAYRDKSTAWTSPTSGADFTLNKPAGTTNGDILLAFVSASEYCGINVPNGWTLVNTSRVDDGSTDVTMFVLKRFATSGDPASWTDGTLTLNAGRRAAIVVCYSGASDILTDTQTATGNDTPLYLTTPTLNNTDQNGWRISAFAVNDNAAGGSLTANQQTPSGVPPITYVGKAAPWGTNNNQTGFTINKPSGTVTNDVMVATLGFIGVNATITPPSGWTLLRQATANNTESGPYTLAVMYRVAQAGEPSSWNGSVSGGSLYRTRVTQCVAYRNVNAAAPFIASNIKATLNNSTLYTNQATNNNSLAWRIGSWGGLSAGANAFSSTNETIERGDDDTYYSELFGGKAGNTVMIADSNGPVGTGAYERYGVSQESLYAGVGFIGFLNPLGTPPASVPNETTRASAAVGSANPWMTLGVFDSAAPAGAGIQRVTGIWAPGSGTDKSSMAGWVGILQPASPVTVGYVEAVSSTVDVSLVDTTYIPGSGRMTITASFIGSTAGTPYLTAKFYRANQLLDTRIAQGSSFGTTTWEKSAATFSVPEGTTRVAVGLSVSDRNGGDVVYWDRVSIGFGDDSTYRASTSRSEHPVWARPHIQYADDDGTGYGEWHDLAGLLVNPPSFEPISGEALYTDHTPIPLTNRKYRARTVSYGLAGDQFVSDWGPDSSEYSFVAENWWLKDIAQPENNLRLKVSWDTVGVNTANTASVFQPIGEELPSVLTEGYKGDMFDLTLRPVNHEDWAELRAMLKSGRTLFLQSDIDHAWWVRPVGDLRSDVLATGQRQSNPLRVIKCSFIQVAAEL